MRCPKCHYISFDSTDRCRNCGYEFALTADRPALDLPIHTADDVAGPLADIPISEFEDLEPSAHRVRPSGAKGRRNVEPSEPVAPPRARPITSVFDLPLFKDRPIDDDTPLVAPPAVPRQPLAVRRSGPVMPRAARGQGDDAAFDLDALEPEVAPIRHVPWLPTREPGARTQTTPAPAVTPDVAGMTRRLVAALADGSLLGGICAAVLYITLQVCGLRANQLALLPVPPLAAFFLLMVGGYFVLMTAAGGQTIGKMAAGIRVVPMDSSDRVSLGHSTMRAAGYLLSVLPVGLGLVPALVHADRRALHDRLADTRVVKA
jgi:uncharacterized RDD family membrane protein YckC